MSLTDDELLELRDGCKKATAGPWTIFHDSCAECERTGRAEYEISEVPSGYHARFSEHADAAHIARCSPDRIEAMATELLAARKALAERGKDLEHASEYSVQLARIIEAICHGTPLRPESANLFHHRMAETFKQQPEAEPTARVAPGNAGGSHHYPPNALVTFGTGGGSLSPALPLVEDAVEVKKLVWMWDDHRSLWQAPSIIGQILAWCIADHGCYFIAGKSVSKGTTEHEAIVAAEADYETRIRSALARQSPKQAAQDVLAERERQKSVEGWTAEHDDGHIDGELARAAVCYATPGEYRSVPFVDRLWPWDRKWWKPTNNRRRMLVKAGALILAEIERLDRQSPKQERG